MLGMQSVQVQVKAGVKGAKGVRGMCTGEKVPKGGKGW